LLLKGVFDNFGAFPFIKRHLFLTVRRLFGALIMNI